MSLLMKKNKAAKATIAPDITPINFKFGVRLSKASADLEAIGSFIIPS